MLRFLCVFFIPFWLVACAQDPQVIDPTHALRQEANKRYEWVIQEMTLPALQRQLFKHREHCAIYFEWQLDPEQVHYATVYYGLATQSAPKELAFIDLTAFSNGKMEAVGYSYYAQNAYLVKAFMAALENPESCPQAS